MNKEDQEAIREEVIESMERSAEVYGLSRSAGRIYGVLYFSTEPLSIPELVEETGYAKSTISNVTRKLSRLGLVQRRSSSGGGRRVRFAAETDLWFVVQDVFRQYLSREMTSTQRSLDQALNRIDSLENQDVEPERQRIEGLQETYADIQRLLELATGYSTPELIEAIEQYDR